MGVINVDIRIQCTSKDLAVLKAAVYGYVNTVGVEAKKKTAEGFYNSIVEQETAQRRVYNAKAEALKK